MKTLLSAVVGATLALGAIQGRADGMPGERQVSFVIESKSLADALDEWAKQTGFQIVVPDWELAKKLTAPRLKGAFTAQSALERLLAGSPLTYVWLNDKAVSIRIRERRSGSVEPLPPEEKRPGTALARFSGESYGSSASDPSVRVEGHERLESQNFGSVSHALQTLDEVVVTGTHIRGDAPVGSQVLVMSKQDIDNTGFATVQDVLQTVPQNFGATFTELQGGQGNFSRGTGVNLRGLGLGTTLTLVNGRRVPMSGDNADYADVSSIPTIAIERVEILTDGASAIYGSDAIGGVANIILKDSYEGAETQARYGAARDGLQETLFGQTFGLDWSHFNALVGYQYYHREPLAMADRSYAASANKTSLGGSDYRSIFGNPGNVFAGFGLFAVPGGQDGTDLEPSDFQPGPLNLGEPREGTDLLQERTTQSGFFSLTSRTDSPLNFFADGRYSKRDFRARSNSFTTVVFVPPSSPYYVDIAGDGFPIGVLYDFIEDLGPTLSQGDVTTGAVTAGLRYDLGPDWTMTASASHGFEKSAWSVLNLVDFEQLALAAADSDPATAFNPLGDGSHTPAATLERIRSSLEGESRSRVTSGTVIADGALFSVPAGAVKIAVGADVREEKLDSARSTAHLDRTVSAVFAEAIVPLWAATNPNDPARLRASVAGRYEEYSDFGDTFNPKIGLQFAPTRALELRATWGTSFRAPRLIDLDETAIDGRPGVALLPGLFSLPDGSAVTGILRGGNNSNLKEETAKSWTAGMDIRLESLAPDLLLSLSYYNIEYKDRIVTPGPLLITDVLLREDEWAPIISRDPGSIAAACAEVIDGDCAATPPDVLVDARLRNISGVETSGIDLAISDRFATAIGDFVVDVSGTYALKYDQKVTQVAPTNDLLDTVFNPVALHVRGSIAWKRGALGSIVAVNHTGAYEDDFSTPNRRIGSWTTFDVGLTYDISGTSTFFDDLGIALRVVNVFDRDPPFANVGLGMDAANATPIGRFASITVQKTW